MRRCLDPDDGLECYLGEHAVVIVGCVRVCVCECVCVCVRERERDIDRETETDRAGEWPECYLGEHAVVIMGCVRVFTPDQGHSISPCS